MHKLSRFSESSAFLFCNLARHYVVVGVSALPVSASSFICLLSAVGNPLALASKEDITGVYTDYTIVYYTY